MIGVRRLECRWSDLGYGEHELTWRGRTTGFKVITRRGAFIAVVSRRYALLPNEVALEAARRAADRLGASEVAVFMGDRRMYALYEVPGPGEELGGASVRLGMYVYNSVDGSTSFGCSLLADIRRLDWRGPIYVLMSAGSFSRVLSPDMAAAIYRRVHTGSLLRDVDKLADRMREVVDRGRAALQFFRALESVLIDEEMASRMADRLPRAYLPRCIRATREGVTIAELVSAWDAYLDSARRIWLGRASIERKIELYRLLNNAVAPRA